MGAVILRGRRAGLLAAGISLAAALWLMPAGAWASPLAHVRVGAAPHHPRGSTVVGPLSGSTRIAFTVTLTPRDPVAPAAYASSVATPGSSGYHLTDAPEGDALVATAGPAEAHSYETKNWPRFCTALGNQLDGLPERSAECLVERRQSRSLVGRKRRKVCVGHLAVARNVPKRCGDIRDRVRPEFNPR